MQSYVELTQIKDDPRFGDIHIMYNPQNPLKRVMRKVNKCQNLQDFEASKKQVQTRKQIDHPNILCLVDNEFNESQMKTSVYFDYPEEMIDLGNLKPIDSVYLLKDILSAILYLQSKRMIHGDIRPEYISYDKLRKNYVLLDRLQDISSPLQTQLNNIKNYKSLYMSPIVFNELMKKTKKIKQNSYKSELFSLGMLCLSIFESSDKVQSFYSSKNKRFDKYAFQELLQNMQKRNYDPVIKEFTDFLTTYVLVYNESKRLNPRNVHEKIIQYKNLSMVFQDQQDEEKEIDQSIETIKDIRKKESLTSTMSDMSYYNPFDFVEVEQEMFQSDNNPEVTDNEPFFDNNKQMRISEKITIDIDAKKQNILVVTQDQFLLDEKDMQRKKQPQIVNDQGKKPLFNKTNSDKLNQLKYFKLKLQINSEPVPNKVTKEKPIRVSTKVIREPQENLEHQIQQIKINQDKKETKQLEQDYILQKVVQKEIQQQKVERRLSEVFSRDDNESISSKPLDSKNSEVRQEGKDYTDYLESLGITIKEEDQEFPNNNLTLAQRLSSLKELEMCIKDEGALIQQQNEMDKSPSNAKKNLKQFLRSTSYKPRDTIQTQEDLNDTSNSRTGQEKKVVQSFNIINPQNKQKKHRRDNNKVITANYQLMNLNNKKEIGKNLKNKIKEYKKGVTSDRFFFNIKRKQSQSPQPRSDNNIIQFENAKRAKSHNMRGPNTQNQFSSRLDYLENSQQKTLTMKVDKLEQCQETQQNLDEKFINEALPLKKDKEGKNIPSDTILKNIEEKLLLKKYKLQEQNSIYSYQQNQARVSINSTNFYETDSIQQGYKKKNIKYSYKLDNRFSSTRENNYFANREQYEQPKIIQNQYLETNDKNNDQNQKIDTASQIKKMYYQTEPRKNSLFVQEKQPNIIKTSIKQDNIDYGNVVNKFEELKNQIIYRDQKKHQNGSSQNSLNITPNQSQMYHKYVPKYSVSRQDQVPRRVVNDKQYNNSIEYTKIRDTSQYKQPRIVSNKYLDFADTNSNHMRNTVNMGSNFHNQVRQQFEQLLQQALMQTLQDPNMTKSHQNDKQIQSNSDEQEFLTKLFDTGEQEMPKINQIAIDEVQQPNESQDIIRKDKDQIAQLVEDIENHQNKQHPLHDDHFEDIAQQFAEALHQQTERMKNAQLLDEHDEQNYHRREVHPEIIVISEKHDNIDHFDPVWEKNNNYHNIERIPKNRQPEIEVIEIPDGYIREPDHYSAEFKGQHEFPQVSSRPVYPKLGMKGNKQFKSELKEIFQELGEFLHQNQPQASSNEEQKTELHHIQATEDDTHYKFAKVTAKEHKIPKDQLDINKMLEVIESLQKNAKKI